MMRLICFLRKEALQFFRDKAIFLFVLYAFTLDVYIAGNGFLLTLKNAGMALFDADRTAVSREVTRRIQAPYFHWEREVSSGREAIMLLDQGRILGALIIPPDFQRNLYQGRKAPLQLLMDGTQITSSTLASSYIAQITARYGREFALKYQGISSSTLAHTPKVDGRIRVFFNPNLEDPYFTALDELFMVVTMISIILSATALVRERDYGTMEQLLVTPIKPSQVIMAKVLFTVITLLIASLITLFLILQGVFRIPFRGSYILFLTVTALYIFSSCGIGLLIATLARRLGQIGLLAILFLAPILFLSGGWVPPEAMPPWMIPLTYLSPLKYYTDLGLGIYLRGEGLALAWKEILALTAVGSAYFLLGLFRFRKTYR
jgi:ABC-2 type transport system permease protein